LIIDKGLGDREYEVAVGCMSSLEFFTAVPSSAALRSLGRRIKRGIPVDVARKFAEDHYAKWTGKETPSRATGRVEPEDDPFGTRRGQETPSRGS
jgi:hypothetical protein